MMDSREEKSDEEEEKERSNSISGSNEHNSDGDKDDNSDKEGKQQVSPTIIDKDEPGEKVNNEDDEKRSKKGKDESKGKKPNEPKEEENGKKKGKEDKTKKPPKDDKKKASKSDENPPTSPRTVVPPNNADKLAIASKMVDLANDFAKNGSEMLRAINENKPKLLPKIGKKIVPALLGKLMKPNAKDTEFYRRRQVSLEEFARVTDQLKSILLTTGKPDETINIQLKQLVEEGHMFLSAVLQKEIATIVSLHNEDKKTVTSINLARLLLQVHVYSDHVSTMKFPSEWETLLEEVNPKYKKEKEKRSQEKNKPVVEKPDLKKKESQRSKPNEEKKDEKPAGTVVKQEEEETSAKVKRQKIHKPSKLKFVGILVDSLEV